MPEPTDREIVMHLATEVMGCEEFVKRQSARHFDKISNHPVRTFGVYDVRGGPIYLCGDSLRESGKQFNPLEDLGDSFEVQTVLARKPKEWGEYVLALTAAGFVDGGALELYSHLLNASPRQRSMAAYLATGGKA